MQFYKNLFWTPSQETENLGDDLLAELAGKTVPKALCEELIRIPSDQEVNEAMWSIPGNKSPGPDGYTSFFFKTAGTLLRQM